MSQDERPLQPGVLQTIMNQHRQPDGSPWTPDAVSRALRERGFPVQTSRQHIHTLATKGGNPKLDLIYALAELFGVSTDEFRGDDKTDDDELARLMYRAGGLTPEKRKALTRYVAYLEHEQSIDQ